MADDPTPGELARRLDEILRAIQGLVSRGEFTAEQRHVEHRFTELERDQEELRRTHAEDIKDLRQQLAEQSKTGSSNFRQAIYNGALPSILLLVSMLVTVLLTLRGR